MWPRRRHHRAGDRLRRLHRDHSEKRGNVAEILKQNGYATAWIGRNHNTPAWETREVGPFDHWPSGLGFDYFYGFNSGDTSQFEPILFENHNLVRRSTDPNYHISHDLVDHAIAWVQRENEIDPARPFFLYVAPSATHAPHMVPKEWSDKFKGQSIWAGTAIAK